MKEILIIVLMVAVVLIGVPVVQDYCLTDYFINHKGERVSYSVGTIVKPPSYLMKEMIELTSQSGWWQDKAKVARIKELKRMQAELAALPPAKQHR